METFCVEASFLHPSNIWCVSHSTPVKTYTTEELIQVFSDVCQDDQCPWLVEMDTPERPWHFLLMWSFL